MDMNELVRSIAQEVLKELKKEEASAPKDCIMVLSPRNTELLEAVKQSVGSDFDFCFSGENQGQSNPVKYVLPYISCTQMADLAAGKADDDISREVLNLLLKGKKVEVLVYEYKTHEQTAPSALFNLYESYEKTLTTFGLSKFEKKKPESMRLKKSLITEQDIITASESGALKLFVDDNTNITPLAVESAKNLNVQLLKQ